MITSVVAGVLPLRLAERGHAVRDRLDTGDRGAARANACSTHEDARATPPAAGRSSACLARGCGSSRPIADQLKTPTPISIDHVDDEEVGRDREDAARLAHAAQVPAAR